MTLFEKFSKLSTGFKFLTLALGGMVLLAVKEWSSKKVRNAINGFLELDEEDED